MAYRSTEVAMYVCEAEKFALVRSVGIAFRFHPAPRADPTRRAKVGYCSRCALSAHAALPPTCALVNLTSRRHAAWCSGTDGLRLP